MWKHLDMPPGDDYESLYRLNMSLRKQVDQLATLREISLAVSASLEMDETMRVVAEVVQGALDVRRLTIYEADTAEGVLRPRVAKYGSDLITQDRLEEESISPRGTKLGQALERHAVLLDNEGPVQLAYVPLIARSQVLGALVLEQRVDGAPFSQDDAALYQMLASPIAIAIHNAQLYAMAVTDGLTRLYVRRYFDLRLAEEFALARRQHRAFSLLMFDIDHFKKFNDTHGHQTGDRVLQQFAQLLRHNTRRSDVCCRYGGEEMAVILPETELREAMRLGGKLCDAVREHDFEGAEGQTLRVTTSVGVASYRPDSADASSVVAAADAALYRAKDQGRDQVQGEVAA